MSCAGLTKFLWTDFTIQIKKNLVWVKLVLGVGSFAWLAKSQFKGITTIYSVHNVYPKPLLRFLHRVGRIGNFFE